MRLAVFGTGTVGSSVARRATDYGHTVVALADSEGAVVNEDGVDVAEVLENKRDGDPVGSTDTNTALESSYEILVEATPTSLGDAEPAFTHVQKALERDKDVILANPGPAASRFDELSELEKASEGTVKLGPTIDGSLPIVSLIRRYGPTDIVAIRGVLNDTANFILSRMDAEKLSYEHVLSEAKGLGITEEGSSSDIDGTGTAVKCTIIANILSSYDDSIIDDSSSVEKVNYEGIKDIPGSLFELAAQDGRTIRLIGEITRNNVRASPRLIDDSSPLSADGAQSTVQIETEHSGTITISGSGSGGSETASAIFSEIDLLAGQ